MLKLSIVLLVFAMTVPASAAPMWLERQAVPKAELIEAAFAARDDASEVVVDHQAWSDFLNTYVVANDDGVNRVRYAGVSKADRASLDAYIGRLEAVDTATLPALEQLAFWINLYNAATVRLVLDNPDVASITEIKKPWGSPVTTVKGRTLTLGDIEHGIVRAVFREPRAHYALNCASIGCPNLMTHSFRGETLGADLDAAARGYINHPRGVAVDGGRVFLSKIYGWYREDFAPDEAGVLDHIRRYASPDLTAALKGAKKVADYRYDWSLNAAP